MATIRHEPILQANVRAFLQNPGERILHDAEEGRNYLRIARESLAGKETLPEAKRKALRLTAFAQRYPALLDDGQLLAGSCRFNRAMACKQPDESVQGFNGNQGHIILDHGRILRDGVAGIQEQIETLLPQGTAQEQANRRAFLSVIRAFRHLIGRHGEEASKQAEASLDRNRKLELTTIADNCVTLAAHPAQTFWQGIQMVWFVHMFALAEGMSSALSFGRFDQYLWPLLKADLAAGRIDMDFAEELLVCFWYKAIEGGESQNLTLGGVGEDGAPAENPLTLLCLDVARKTRLHQPSLSLRIHEDTPDEVWNAAMALVATGDGQPSFVSDAVTVAGLQRLGIPENRARDWAVVGCYEPSTQGDCGAFTVAGRFSLPKHFSDFFAQHADYPVFSAFYDAFLCYLSAQAFPQEIMGWRQALRRRTEFQASPFEAVCVGGCIESGRTPEEAGAVYNLFGVNVLGFGTMIDSLHTVDELVFRQKKLTLAELRDAVRDDFPDDAVYYLCRNVDGRYGGDHEATNRLAAEFSLALGGMFDAVDLAPDVRINASLFAFGVDIMDGTIPTTPDGRRKGEPCSYGAGPAAHAGSTVTAILNSVAQVRHDRFANGTPLMLSFAPQQLEEPGQRLALRSLIESYFSQGGFHVQFNLVDAETLRQAKQDPAKHTGVQIRVSGFSARFTSLAPRWQDVLINRIEQGQ